MIYRVFGALILMHLASCATDTSNLAPPEALEPEGWNEVESSLAGENFSDYAGNVRQRLVDYRIPLDPADATQEIDRASPQQIEPVTQCNSNVEGIALLVHGLSDTAFAMHDLAKFFARQCYIARTVLLPGHGIRPGDLLVVDHRDWHKTIKHLIRQASDEHDRVVLVGFSLGAVITMSAALEADSGVDALVAISPAYHISTWKAARFAPWVHLVYRWIDKGMADDSQRFEAMPTKGVASLVRAMKDMHARIADVGSVPIPWMLVHSLDDNTTVPAQNMAFVLERSSDKRSKVLNFYSDQVPGETTANVQWLKSTSDKYKVTGLTHLAAHVAPDNSHYGIDGDYRHCGGIDGRDATDAQLCENAEEVVFSDWNKVIDGSATPTALSSFNPAFPALEASITEFLSQLR